MASRHCSTCSVRRRVRKTSGGGFTQGTVAHYRVLQEVGRGGMGVVCKAEDLRLGRTVALKFLPSHLTRDVARRERLLREARAASSLDHPNICTIHEVEESGDGQIVLVMAYYEGETLSSRIKRGRMPLPAAMQITRKILSGLKHAHERGVVHRDIKPSNVILTFDDEVKIVDFGLAKFSDSAECLTETGGLMGTLAYLPPESLEGHGTDHRGDVWSSGVVFYEMLSGAPPFAGTNAYMVLQAIMHGEAKPICGCCPDLPEWVGRVVERALAKHREQRYQSAAEFLASLDEHAGHAVAHASSAVTRPVTTHEHSIAVLPFVVLGSEARDAIFSDGLLEEIITDLSAIANLRVICRSSASRLKEADPRKVATELNVRYVMEGTVRTSGAHLRVTAKLVDPTTDSVLWAEKYSGNLDDIFAIQENLSRRIVEALKLKLSPSESLRLSDRPIRDLRAYEYYLRAKHEILSYTNGGLERALDYLRKGEQIIGENVMLLSSMGQVYWQYINAGISTDTKYLDQAEECARRIFKLDAGSEHGHRLLGLVAAARGRTQEAVRLLKKSLESNANDPDTLSWLCAICSMSGKSHAVVPMAQKLIAIDPLTTMWHIVPGLVAMLSGEYERALGPFECALAGDPKNAMLHMVHAQSLAMGGRTAEALAELDAMQATPEPDFFVKLGAFYACAVRGDRRGTLAAADAELSAAALADMNYAWILAQGYALIDERQTSLACLRTAVEKGFINYPLLHGMDPFLERLHSEERFAELMESTRQQWEAFEV